VSAVSRVLLQLAIVRISMVNSIPRRGDVALREWVVCSIHIKVLRLACFSHEYGCMIVGLSDWRVTPSASNAAMLDDLIWRGCT